MKVRGTPQQILDKYLSLARDASSAGEHITAEGYYQFAEHYYRIINADGGNGQNKARSGRPQGEDGSSRDADRAGNAAEKSSSGGDAVANESEKDTTANNEAKSDVGDKNADADSSVAASA